MYCFDLNSPIRLRIDKIQKNEFVYFKINAEIESDQESLAPLLDSLSKASTRLFFSTGDPEKILGLKEMLRKFPVAWIGADVPVGSNQQGVKKGHTSYSNIDSVSVSLFKKLKEDLGPEIQIIPEFVFGENHFQMGPTIAYFINEFNLPFVFIKVQGPPTSAMVQNVKETFESLRINGIKKKIYFSFNNPYLREWNIKTYNSFSGLQYVHLDISNKCTHSCLFCGLWGPDFIDDLKKRSPDHRLSSDIVQFMNQQMPTEKAMEIIDSLPETVDMIQLGGVGDPLTHPEWFKIISHARNRGFAIDVLSNFEYPTPEQIEELHLLSKGKYFDFWINVSAASAEVYRIVRPRQSESTFKKVISNIERIKNLKERDGFGINITMSHVINVHNYKEAAQMVELAHELGTSVYLKPLEVHADTHQNYIVPKDQHEELRLHMKRALQMADELKVRIVLREQMEAIIAEDLNNSMLLVNETALEKSELDWGVINGKVPLDLYQTIPCMSGFTYSRFEVNGSIRPCCAAPVQFGDMNRSSFDDLWHSLSIYSWRSKFLRIHKTRFHLKDKEFGFCQMCPHLLMNIESNRLMNLERP